MNVTTRPVALITGPSTGIGRALAFACADAGYDLVLIGRDQERLRLLRGDLQVKYPSQVTTVEWDLADSKALANLDAAYSGPADLLVNNAGFGVHGGFATTSLAREHQLVDVQLQAMLTLVKKFLPGMLARGQGRILNVGSLYSLTPVPFQAVYGACKAFMWSYSVALRDELRGSGVTVTVLCPGSTRTAFRAHSDLRLRNPDGGMSAELVAAQGLAGALAGKLLVVPGWSNKLFAWAALNFPARWTAAVLRRVNARRGVNGSNS